MISISRYLNSAEKHQFAAEGRDSHFAGELCGLSSQILDCINQYVLTGDGNESRRSEIGKVKEGLRPMLSADEAARAAESVSSILAAHNAVSQRASLDQVMEAQHIFGMLNQALINLTENNGRDVSRLSTIQESVQRAAALHDMSAMKASLAETVQFIKVEATKARETAAKELGRLETEVASAREFFGGSRMVLGGRPEAVDKISDSLENLIPGEALYLVAYLCDKLAAVTQRYGPAVTDELVALLIRERLKPVMPENTMYRWTPSSVVAVFSRPCDAAKLRSEVASLNRTPLVHKIALGGRTAVLTLSPSHLIAEGLPGSPEALIEQVDKFTGART